MPFNGSEHARIAALSRVAKEPSGEAMNAKARRVYRDSFDIAHVGCKYGCSDTVIDQALPAKEVRRMGEASYRAHMTRLSHRRKIMHRRAKTARRKAKQITAELSRLDDAV
jgi:hypothetical protein